MPVRAAFLVCLGLLGSAALTGPAGAAAPSRQIGAAASQKASGKSSSRSSTKAAGKASGKAGAKSSAKSSGKASAKAKGSARTRSSGRARAAVPDLPVRAAADDSAAAREARDAFARYTEAFNSARDLDAVAFYSDDSRFHWVEDGRVAYTSSGMIRESIAGVRKLFPTMRFEPGEVRTTVFGRDAVQLTVPFVQRLVDGGGVESRFEGTMTMSLTKASGSWRVLTGHTSLRRPGGR